MAWYHEVGYSLRSFTSRRRQESEMNEEVRYHIEMETQRNIQAGLRPQDNLLLMSRCSVM